MTTIRKIRSKILVFVSTLLLLPALACVSQSGDSTSQSDSVEQVDKRGYERRSYTETSFPCEKAGYEPAEGETCFVDFNGNRRPDSGVSFWVDEYWVRDVNGNRVYQPGRTYFGGGITAPRVRCYCGKVKN